MNILDFIAFIIGVFTIGPPFAMCLLWLIIYFFRMSDGDKRR